MPTAPYRTYIRRLTRRLLRGTATAAECAVLKAHDAAVAAEAARLAPASPRTVWDLPIAREMYEADCLDIER